MFFYQHLAEVVFLTLPSNPPEATAEGFVSVYTSKLLRSSSDPDNARFRILMPVADDEFLLCCLWVEFKKTPTRTWQVLLVLGGSSHLRYMARLVGS